MAKKNKSKKTKKVQKPIEEEEPVSEEEEETYQKVTLEQIDAMSDGEEDEIEEWDAEAKALRQAIAEGAFDKINLNKVENDEEADEVDSVDKEMSEGEDESESGSDEEDDQLTENKTLSGVTNIKALKSVTSLLVAQKDSLPWPEKLDVIPPTPLPFGQKTEDGATIQVHDDLKREVAFYNVALQSVYAARTECGKLNIPFSRPEDFFAEMVKNDGTFHFFIVRSRF